MKVVETRNGFVLEGIKKDDIRFSNLAGRMTGSEYDDPERPQHVFIVWIENEDLVRYFADQELNVKEVTREVKDENGDTVGTKVCYSLRFKAYPKMRPNRLTGREEPYPKVIMKTTNEASRINVGSFGLVDAANVDTIDIRYHLYVYKKDTIGVIDEMWVTVDESAGEVDDTYLSEKYGIDDAEIPW